MWQSDLGDAYIEIGRISDAIALYGQVLDATRSDLARFGLGRAYLYAGRGVSEDYDKAIEQLQGIDPTFRGQIEPGGAQIALSAAQIGRKDDTRMNKQQKSAMTAEAKSNLCAGIKKSEDFWRAVLNGTKPLVHFSFKEEIRLTGELGGGKIRC
jgi:tetratricopeptide (TPR) repeat protein